MPSRDSFLEHEIDKLLGDNSFIDAINSWLYRDDYHNYKVVSVMLSPSHDRKMWVVRALQQNCYYKIEMDTLFLAFEALNAGNGEAIYRYLAKEIDRLAQGDWEYIERQIARQHD